MSTISLQAMKSYQTYRIDCLNAEAKLREAERQEEKRGGGRHSDPGGSPGGAGLDKAPRRTSLKKVERLLEKVGEGASWRWGPFSQYSRRFLG